MIDTNTFSLFSYNRKYLDIHSMHRLEKTASTEEMREYGGGGGGGAEGRASFGGQLRGRWAGKA